MCEGDHVKWIEYYLVPISLEKKIDDVVERLIRCPAKAVPFGRAGSNPAVVALFARRMLPRAT